MQAEHSRPTGPPEHSRVVQPRTQHGQQARHHDDSSLAAHSWPAGTQEHSSLVLSNTISSPLKHSRPAGPPRRAGICAQHAPAAHPQPAASASIQILSSRIQSVLAFTGKPHRTQVDSTGRPARAFKFCPSTSNPRPLFKFSTVFRSSAGPPEHCNPIYSRLAFKPRTHRDGQQARASIQVFSMHWQAHLSRFSTAGAATGRAKVERAAALWAFRLRAGRDSDCRVEPRQTDSSHDSENLKQTAIKLRASRDREFLSNEQQ